VSEISYIFAVTAITKNAIRRTTVLFVPGMKIISVENYFILFR